MAKGHESVKKTRNIKLTKRVSNSRKTQTTELARAPDVLKGGPFRTFQHPLLQNIKKLKGHPLGIFFRKSL